MSGLSIIHDDIETIVANSYRNFHAKGLDYLCLQRSPQMTVKAYFFSDRKTAVPEVVCPHDHRYPFATTVIAGTTGHKRYVCQPDFLNIPPNFQMFTWRTPLIGGTGFQWVREARLDCQFTERYEAGQTYFCRSDEIHTIQVHSDDTILLLTQFADVVPLDEPTFTFVPGDNHQPPSLDGLYDRMTADVALSRLAQLRLARPDNGRG